MLLRCSKIFLSILIMLCALINKWVLFGTEMLLGEERITHDLKLGLASLLFIALNG